MGLGSHHRLCPPGLVARHGISSRPTADGHFTTYLYFSGTTFFTLGYGDLVPTGAMGRVLSVAEAGIGFGFLAVVISYLPVLYQAFSRREIIISLLDARAGSPPSAGELLRRLAEAPAWRVSALPWSNGNAGRRNCWRAICRSRC